MAINLVELLNTDELTAKNFNKFVEEKGLNNISKQDLDWIIAKFGMEVFVLYNFPQIYSMKCADKTNRVMIGWTVAIGLMTLVMLGVTIYAAFKSAP